MYNTSQLIINLNALTDKKIELFQDILIVTKRQKEEIEINQADNIEPLVEEKQGIINNVDEIDKAFNNQFLLLKEELGIKKLEDIDVNKYPDLRVLKEKVQKTYTLIREIMQIEEANKDKITVIFNNTKNELKKMSIGKKSIKAYETHIINTDGIYIDKKK